MPHNFWKSLQFEKRKFQMADHVYFDSLCVEEITRFDTGTKHDMEFQKQDIDVQLHAWGRFANVSEKFRDKDYGDLYLELYSMFPNTLGWMDVTGADYLAYFFPLRMLWINKSELKKVFEKCIKQQIPTQKIEVWIMKNPKQCGRFSFYINNFKMQIVIAYNRTKTKEWYTVGVCVPFKYLKQQGLSWKQYHL